MQIAPFRVWILVSMSISYDMGGLSLRGVMAEMLDCGHDVSEFKLQSLYYVYFRTNAFWERYNPPYPSS